VTEEVITQIKEAAVRYGVVINKNKIKHMKIHRNITNLDERSDNEWIRILRDSEF
jgi:hypothetical protein